METAAECVCCQHSPELKSKCNEVVALGLGAAPECITKHPGFASVCLDTWVLQAVYNKYRQRYGHIEKPLFELVTDSCVFFLNSRDSLLCGVVQMMAAAATVPVSVIAIASLKHGQ